MSKKHALLSPSSATRWPACPGSVLLSKDIPDTSSSFAAEGSCAHEVGENILLGITPHVMVGSVFHGVEVSEEMVAHCVGYAETIREYKGDDGELLVEVRLDISGITGESDAKGTADAVVLKHADLEIVVADLKYGRGERVSAIENSQLMIYALAVYLKYAIVAEWKQMRLVIVQPRNGGVSEWVVPVEDLLEFGARIKTASDLCFSILKGDTPLEGNLHPGEKQCRWCKAKPTCPAIRAEIMSDFENLDGVSLADTDDIGAMLDKCDQIDGWTKSIRDEARRRLNAGIPVKGYKLVEGKRGNRSWSDAGEVESLLKSMKLTKEQMYDMSLISPTVAEKRLAKEHPIQWAKVTNFVMQKAGGPTIASDSDPRPALSPDVSNDFENLNKE